MGNVMDCGWGATPNPDELINTNQHGADIELRIPVQAATRLEDSILWKLQKNFYDYASLLAWTGDTVIPNFVTSNCYIAKLYADLVFNNILDIFNSNNYNPQEPIYILEIGAGSGKLGFLLLEKLIEVKEFFPKSSNNENVREYPFIYVMTEVSAEMIDFYQKHPKLSPLLKSGILDIAIFDSEKDNEISLIESKRVLSLSNPTLNPIILIGNYLFDSLRQTAYRIEDGEYYESYCTIETRAPSPQQQQQSEQQQQQEGSIDLNSTDIINSMIVSWKYEKIEKEKINEEEYIKNILFEYEEMKEASIIIPIGGIKLLKLLENICNNKLIAIIGDKGYSNINELNILRDPHIALHGSFSFMVNFDSICKYINSRNGYYINTPYCDGFKVFNYFIGLKKEELSNTLFTFKESMISFGPESFSTLQRCIKEESIPKFKHLQALLRLSDGDADVFYKFRGIIVEQGTSNISADGSNCDLILDLKRIAKAIYPLQKQKDISFELGRLFMGLKLYHEAINYFNQSIEYCNEHYVTYHNMGVSYYYLQDYTHAEDCFRKSLKLKASYRDAQVWLERVEQAIQEIQHTGATPIGGKSSINTPTPISTPPPPTTTSDGNNNNNNNNENDIKKESEVVKVDDDKEQQPQQPPELEQGDVIRQDSNNDVIAVVDVSEK